MTIAALLEQLPEAATLFPVYGLRKFLADDVRQCLGSVLKLKTALNMARSDVDKFIAAANDLYDELHCGDFSSNYHVQEELTMLGLMPCGMKMPFKRRFDEFAAALPASPEYTFRYLVEGNVNHELSYYPYIDRLENTDELPDVIVSSDINSFFHHQFVDSFLRSGEFESLNHPQVNRDFAGIDYFDPDGVYTMLSANLLVLVVNRHLLRGLPEPRSWADLCDPIYQDTITMRGQDGFFCNGVLLPFYQWGGIDSIQKMVRSVKTGLHPAEMVDQIEKESPQGTPFYIMPMFFAHRLKKEALFKIIYPEEGAIVSPVFMLVRKNKKQAAAAVADYISGREMGQFCADAGFPSIRQDVDNKLPEGCRLSWMGWEFLKRYDPAAVKSEIDGVFKAKFRKN